MEIESAATSPNTEPKKAHQAERVMLGRAWQLPSTSMADFRSDIGTTPTPTMLQAALGASLEDVFDSGASPFERYLADITGMDSALLCISGTMANQIALRTHLVQPPMSILADQRSHILTMEGGACAWLTGAMIQPVAPSNGIHLTLDDVQRAIVLAEDLYNCPTRAIAAFAHEHSVRVHIDGARLWEAVAAGAGSLRDFCAAVDSVSLCFTKGLCAPVGSVLVGGASFISRASKVRKSLGGAMRQPGIVAAMAAAGLFEIFGQGSTGSPDALLRSHRLARDIADVWTAAGGRLTMPVQTNMVCLDLGAAGLDEQDWIESGKAAGLLLRGSRIVTHCQIDPKAVEKLKLYIRNTLLKSNA